MSSDDIRLPQWSVLDGYFGSRQTPPARTLSLERAIADLKEQAFLPISQKSLYQIWCTQPPHRERLYEMLDDQNMPTSARVLALNVLACKPEPQDLPMLWQTFMHSRFGVISEDPDLFTRSLQIITSIEQEYPKSNQEIFRSVLPPLFQNCARKRDQVDLSIQNLQQLLPAFYQQYAVQGIQAFHSEYGSVFQDIILQSQQNQNTVPNLPQNQPGQYQKVPTPKFHQAEILQYSPQWTPSILGIGLLGIMMSFLGFRGKYKRWVALLFGVSLVCGLEGGLALFEQPTYAQLRPLFSFIDFSFQPYEELVRKEQRWWISQGGPSRWQEIPDRDEIFRIAVLGASSAHGSNLVQEEAFASILEKQLQSEFTETPIQVVNMSIGGTISNGILSSGMQALEMGADAIIIYYGHNEVAQFQQLTNFQNTNGLSIRILFSQSRIYAWLTTFLPRKTDHTTIGIEKKPEPSTVIQWAASNHRQNLGLLLEECTKKHIPVLQIIPTYNFRFAPFEPNHLEDSSEAENALEHAKESRPIDRKATIKALRKSISLSSVGSSTFVQAHQILAESLSQEGLHKQARDHYQNVFDHAKGTTTIHSEIKQNIERLAEKHGTALLDAQDIFYHNSMDGLSANGLFWDELHPNARGHQFLAQGIIPWAREQTSNFRESFPNR